MGGRGSGARTAPVGRGPPLPAAGVRLRGPAVPRGDAVSQRSAGRVELLRRRLNPRLTITAGKICPHTFHVLDLISRRSAQTPLGPWVAHSTGPVMSNRMR